MKADLLFVGLDVHAQSITVAVAENDRSQPRLYGSIPNDLHAVERMLSKLKKPHPGADLRVFYEAGPTGFGLARRCQQLKVDCAVAAPSLIPSFKDRSAILTHMSALTPLKS